jgi:hypothetical protein
MDLIGPMGMMVVVDNGAISVKEKGRVTGHTPKEAPSPFNARISKGGLTEGLGGVEPTLNPA